MESSRHHHHSVHSCQHNKNRSGVSHSQQSSGAFERYGGGFPQLSRIFPPISSSDSTSSTDSDLHVSRRFRFHRKWCACVLVAVLFVGLGAAAGIYFGYQFLSLTPAMEQLFRGSITITKGDKFTDSLTNHDSAHYRDRSLVYKNIIDSLYSQSLVKNAFLGSEILAFDGVENGPLTVFFNIHVDTHRIRIDAGDLFIVLADAIRNSGGILNGNITVDEDSLEIQERSMAFLYLPSTERTYVSGSNPNLTSKEPSNHIVVNEDFSTDQSPTESDKNLRKGTEYKTVNTERPEESTTTQIFKNKNNPHHHALPPSTSIINIGSTGQDRKYPKIGSNRANSKSNSNGDNIDLNGQCMPLDVPFCQNVTTATRQNVLDEITLLQLAAVVESHCYPFAAHFLCSWGIACKEDTLVQGGKAFNPCKDYCDEFLSNCGHKLPQSIKDKIQCGSEWKGLGSCVTKPGCVSDLYSSGQSHRVCDGIMDCQDFADELHCPYCPPGNFHCGAGKECIAPEKKCDGVTDCPNGSDEKACLTLAPSSEAAGYVHQYFNEGYLFVHDQGKLGKLCVERNDSHSTTFWQQESQLLLDNIGHSACELLGFRKVAFVRIQPDSEVIPRSPNSSDATATTYVRIQEPGSSSEVTFTAGRCPSKKVLYVGCNHLECGQRPSHQRRSKGKVGHGDWPWHAALLRDGKHVGDASLVTSQWLITSDQLFVGQTKARWTVHFGRVRMSTASPWQQERRVVGMVKSPLGDNLVLIKMASPVIFSDFARHVCLPEEAEERDEQNPSTWQRYTGKCVRLGWSRQEELMETAMHQLNDDNCPQSYGFSANSTKHQLCFENNVPGRDCLKELKIFPGGPIYCQNEESKEWALAGIAPAESRPKCGIEKYRLTAIGGSTEWILKTIEALSTT